MLLINRELSGSRVANVYDPSYPGIYPDIYSSVHCYAFVMLFHILGKIICILSLHPGLGTTIPQDPTKIKLHKKSASFSSLSACTLSVSSRLYLYLLNPHSTSPSSLSSDVNIYMQLSLPCSNAQVFGFKHLSRFVSVALIETEPMLCT